MGVLIVLGSTIAVAQSVAGKDSVHVDPEYVALYRGLYEKAWSEKFAELWNSNKDTAKVLGGMGKVYFASVSADTTCALFDFDSLGQARFLKVLKGTPPDTLPIFTSRIERWADFMEGKLNAVAGVLSGKIRYKGPMTLAFKYGFLFNKVAPVGKRTSQMIHQKQKK
ncbi:MAG: hypothetical protein HYR76_00610 [Ignavibacteria bacterium]|nr:hypothetical protein [Ignavibacteria bacterium]